MCLNCYMRVQTAEKSNPLLVLPVRIVAGQILTTQ